ncbi:hypothetical protein PtA15_1A186 [Puccinia triticina]|uniref:J domain-containing protein n=1 Tax=Puccinia triticina TaxID=208348 RepID=A0ABY7C912_9BASI|nr:uncharacterized protein PtA15_1A186 [Puccinia triticina]WAQ80848.1 hypothetical protein PtA15_1A186 [Puccinia triticina]
MINQKLRRLRPSLTNPSSNRNPLAASYASASSSSSSSTSFEFPSSRSPSPFEIFHLPRSASTSQIKERYYELVKVYHPDVATSKSNNPPSSALREDEITRRFKLIRDAYELLSSPSRRQRYIRFQEGWNDSRAQTPNRSWRNNSTSTTWTNQAAYADSHFNLSSVWRQFINRHQSARAGFYSSVHDDGSNHHWFNNQQGQSHTFKQQWERDGLFTKNGIFISAVGCVSLCLYLVQLWRVLPLVGSDDRAELPSEKEKTKFRKFIEPTGDDRLDQEAWSKLRAIQFTTVGTNGRVDLGASPAPLRVSSLIIPSHDPSPHQLQPTHRFYSSSFQDRIQKQNLKAVSDLKSARAAAVKPSVFSSRISQSSHSTTTP